MAQESPNQIVIVSNRLPCVIEESSSGWNCKSSSGGLITALAPVLRSCNGVWVGWPGTVDEDDVDAAAVLKEARSQFEYRLLPVSMPRDEKEGFYEGFANQVLWPLFHSLNERCDFAPPFWSMYKRVNRRFANATRKFTGERDTFIWVHDYHLMLVAEELRKANVRNRIGFFLHTPFPPPEMFLKMPWREEVLRGLLAYDLVGFQTIADRRNFVRCVRTLIRECKVRGHGRVQIIAYGRHEVKLGNFPISIDFDEFAQGAEDESVKAEHDRLAKRFEGRRVILGIDRLDYTKGIPSRLRAFRETLTRFPDLARTTTYVQLVVPSRGSIGEYQTLREEIQKLVGEINGRFTELGYVPLHYMYRGLTRTQLLALYRLADVCLVTPLNDGMNLVAKEYCACNAEATGTLILSEFAGAAVELRRGAILVNPYDYESMAESIRMALTMPKEECRVRMERMRRYIRQHDVHTWAQSFVDAGVEPVEPASHGEHNEAAESYDAELSVHEMVRKPVRTSAPRSDAISS